MATSMRNLGAVATGLPPEGRPGRTLPFFEEADAEQPGRNRLFASRSKHNTQPISGPAPSPSSAPYHPALYISMMRVVTDVFLVTWCCAEEKERETGQHCGCRPV